MIRATRLTKSAVDEIQWKITEKTISTPSAWVKLGTQCQPIGACVQLVNAPIYAGDDVGRPKYRQQVLRKVAAKFRAKWTGLLFASRAACFDQSNYKLIRTDSGCSSRLAHQPHFGHRFATGTSDQPNPADAHPLLIATCRNWNRYVHQLWLTHSIIYYSIILFKLHFPLTKWEVEDLIEHFPVTGKKSIFAIYSSPDLNHTWIDSLTFHLLVDSDLSFIPQFVWASGW